MRRTVWHCGRFDFGLDRTLVMGVLNVTPDSFSDGGRFASPGDAVAAGTAMLAEGADLVDVGGESTRPGADEVPVAEELRRVLSVVRGVEGSGAVSIDTRHPDVAAACVDAGAVVLNDVTGFGDPAMVAVAADSDAGCIVTHMRGLPATMQEEPRYDDVVAEVREFLGERAASLEAAGVARERIAVDPGIGFGKTTRHNLALLRSLPSLASLGYPVVVGVSRKRFIGELTGVEEPADRLEGSLAAAAWSAAHGADVVRVHDVAAHVRALRVTDALRSGQD